MSRRLRFALLLAAIVAAGPSASAPRIFDAARAGVSIAWLRADLASRPERRHASPAIRIAAVRRVELLAPRDIVLPDTPRLHSLFQRPPPLRS